MTDRSKMTKAELIQELEALEQYAEDLENSKVTPMEPMVQWTIKTVAPGGSQQHPDFITLKYHDFEAALREHHERKGLLSTMGYTMLGGESRPSGSQSPQTETGDDEMYIAKYELERLKDQRLKLQLFGTFDDGGLHRFADIYFTTEETDMWDMLRNVGVDDSVHPTLPVEETCEWIATYKQGRPKTKGTGHYKDLVMLKEA